MGRNGYVSGFLLFDRAVKSAVPVAGDEDKQFAAITLLRARKVCAYETLAGLIGEIGVPKNPNDGGRIFRCARRQRQVRAQKRGRPASITSGSSERECIPCVP